MEPSEDRMRITELNPHLLCALCGGYLIDATTIVECLHSFCKTCIVRYLETSNYCPMCEVLIHKTRPWQNIRYDETLQNIVYKIVPGLFKNEMKRRRDFYEQTPCYEARRREGKELDFKTTDRVIHSPDEDISLSLEHCIHGRPSNEIKIEKDLEKVQDRRYLMCPAAVTVSHLKKYIRMKYSLSEQMQIDVIHTDAPLRDSWTLMDVAYIYSWRRQGILKLFYSFYQVLPKKRKLPELSQGPNITDESEVSDAKRKDITETQARTKPTNTETPSKPKTECIPNGDSDKQTESIEPPVCCKSDSIEPLERCKSDSIEALERCKSDSIEPLERCKSDSNEPLERCKSDSIEALERCKSDSIEPLERCKSEDACNSSSCSKSDDKTGESEKEIDVVNSNDERTSECAECQEAAKAEMREKEIETAIDYSVSEADTPEKEDKDFSPVQTPTGNNGFARSSQSSDSPTEYESSPGTDSRRPSESDHTPLKWHGTSDLVINGHFKVPNDHFPGDMKSDTYVMPLDYSQPS